MKKFLFLSTLILCSFAFSMNDQNSQEEMLLAKVRDLANNIEPTTGLPLLCAACMTNQSLDHIEMLLKFGANPNAPAPNGPEYKGNYPLHFAALHAATKGDDSLKKLLIQYGADQTLKNESGKTANDLERSMREFIQLVDKIKHFKINS